MHEQLARAEAARVDLVALGVLAQGRHEGFDHALLLHPQRIDDICLCELVDLVGHRAAELLDSTRDEGRRTAHRDLGAHQREGEDVRACHPAVHDVADDPDPLALDRSDALDQREDVEQGLGRVLTLSVAGVDDRGLGPAGDEISGPGVRRADDDCLRVIGRERRDRVLERLALVDR